MSKLTSWLHSPVATLLWFVAIVIVVADAIYQNDRFVSPGAVFQTQSIALDSGRAILHVRYPQLLEYKESGEPGSPFYFWITPSAKGTDASAYLVKLDHSGDMVFVDSSQAITVAEFLLPVSQSASQMRAVFLRPLLLKDGRFAGQELSIAADRNGTRIDVSPARIPLTFENETARWYRKWGDYLFGGSTIWLPLFLAITGVLVEVYKRRQESEKEQKQELVRQHQADAADRFARILATLNTEPLHALSSLNEPQLFTDRQVNYGLLHETLKRIWSRISEKEYHAKLLKTAGEHFQLQDPRCGRRELSTLLSVLRLPVWSSEGIAEIKVETEHPRVHDTTTAYLSEFERSVAVLLSWQEETLATTSSDQTAVTDDTPYDPLINAIVWIWDQFLGDSYEVIVYTITLLTARPRANPLVHTMIREGRLDLQFARDSRLAPHLDPFGISVPQWPVNQPSPLPEPDDIAKKWLREQGLRWNPFHDVYPWFVNGHAGLPKPAPLHEQRCFTAEHMVAACDRQLDRLYARSYVCSAAKDEKASEPKKRIFAVDVDISSWPGRLIKNSEMYTVLCQALAQTWIDYLACNSLIVQQMSGGERNDLAELLLWAFGSKASILSRVQQRQRLCDLRSKPNLAPIESIASDTTASLSQPTELSMYSWLGLRPPTMLFTCYLLEINGEQQEMHEFWDPLLCNAGQLVRLGVWIKAFAPQSVVDPNWGVPIISLEWSNQSLADELRLRYARSHRPDFKDEFDQLFDLDVIERAKPSVPDFLAKNANGSISRLLALGHAVIEASVRRYNQDPNNSPMLNWEELESIIERTK